MFSIQLPENPTAEQVAKAMRAISFWAGADVTRAAGTSIAAESFQPQPVGKTAAEAFGGGDDEDTVTLPLEGVKSSDTLGLKEELDSTGLPYDARIHSGNKTKNQDGSWKARKGLDDAVKASVMAELRAKHSMAQPPAPDPLAIPAFLDRRVPPPPPPAAAPATVADGPTYMTVITKVGKLIAEKKITNDDVAAICADVGLKMLPLLKAQPDLIPVVDMMIDAKVAE